MTNLKQTIWFFDIDDTLIDTAGLTLQASEGILEVLTPALGGKKAKAIQNEFQKTFNTILSGHQSQSAQDKQEYSELISKIEKMQTPVLEEFGTIKKWSRECFLKIAFDKLNISATSDLIQKSADAYWNKLTEITKPFPKAIELFRELKRNQIPIFLITSSDARLQMDETGLFHYDPAYSEEQKKKRLVPLTILGFEYDGLSVGDPEDKPSKDFFQKGLSLAERKLGHGIDRSHCIIVGDSYEGDLKTPIEKLGFKLAIQFVKNQKDIKKISEKHITTGNLFQVLELFS